MPTSYTVNQGDYLAKIAANSGVSNPDTIWNDSQNAKLKQERKNPNVLFPGDVVVIPDRAQKQESGPTEQRLRLQLKRAHLKLRLVLEDTFNKPFANTKCELTVDGVKRELVSDGKGKIETDIPATATAATLVIKDPDPAVGDRLFPIQIGHLDPVDKPSGQKGRLNNLGYFAGAPEEDDADSLRSAVEEFQCEHMGKGAVDGVCGSKTQAKLLEVHGC